MIFIPSIQLIGITHNNWYDIMPGDICLIIELTPGWTGGAECLILHPEHGAISSVVSEKYGQLIEIPGIAS